MKISEKQVTPRNDSTNSFAHTAMIARDPRDPRRDWPIYNFGTNPEEEVNELFDGYQAPQVKPRSITPDIGPCA